MQRFAIAVVLALALGGHSLKRGRVAGGAPASIPQLTQRSDAVAVPGSPAALRCQRTPCYWLEMSRRSKADQARTSHCRELDFLEAERGRSVGRSGSRPRHEAFFFKGSSVAAWDLVPPAQGRIGSLRAAYYPVPRKSDRGAASTGDEPAEKALLLLLDTLDAGAVRPDSPQVLWAEELRLAGERPSVRQAVDRLAGSSNENLSSLAFSTKVA